MPQLTPAQARVVDPVLSNVAQGYRNAELVGDALFPFVPVLQRGGKIVIGECLNVTFQNCANDFSLLRRGEGNT